MVNTSQVLGSCSTYKPLAISYRDEPSQAATTLYCPPRNDVQARAQVREYSTDILLIVSTVQVYSKMQARAQVREYITSILLTVCTVQVYSQMQARAKSESTVQPYCVL